MSTCPAASSFLGLSRHHLRYVNEFWLTHRLILIRKDLLTITMTKNVLNKWLLVKCSLGCWCCKYFLLLGWSSSYFTNSSDGSLSAHWTQKMSQVWVSKIHHRCILAVDPATLQGYAFRNLQLQELKAALTLRLLSLQPELRNPWWIFFLDLNDGKSSWEFFPSLPSLLLCPTSLDESSIRVIKC